MSTSPSVENARNLCLGERHGGGLRFAHFNTSVLEVWDLQAGGEDGVGRWMLAHQAGAMELVQRNPEAARLVSKSSGGSCIEGLMNTSLYLLAFHPTDDAVFLDVGGVATAYSVEHGAMAFQGAGRYLPYAHPPHPVKIPAIRTPAQRRRLN